ncbi:MAG: acyl-CoA thioesterase [Paenibacillaceae bacterium]|jgi:lysophospholipase L1-like esterase|nr:acyl-CoA thioesterase [Paenibacillaceae bacterium]
MLHNTSFLLQDQKKLNVCFFGGSITEGAGASAADQTSWRGLTTLWLKGCYPDARIEAVNAAIGGTPSGLGVYRCGKDVLAYQPDLVFVEFAVNDYGANEETIALSMEGIVRQILTHNPYADIVFVYTLTEKMDLDLGEGGRLASVEIHQKIAAHYGIPAVYAGMAISGLVAEGNGDWSTYTTDTVHPNDTGYALYAERVTGFLQSSLGQAGDWERRSLPSPLGASVYVRSELYDAWLVQESQFARSEESLRSRYPHMICAEGNGEELVLTFSGTAVGLYYMIAHDSGILEWQLDEGPAKAYSTWDKHALNFDRAGFTLLAEHLENREHKLRIRAIGQKDPQSKGTRIRIGAFLVGETKDAQSLAEEAAAK